MKEIITIIGVILTFVGHVPYIKDVLDGKTRPHVYTWFVWSLLTFILFALQVSDQAGPGAYVTLAAGLVSFFIFFLGMRQGKKDITKMDTLLLVTALFGLTLWLFAKQATFSTILLVSVDLIAFLPTVRKSWSTPDSETAKTYSMNAFRHGLSVFALERYTIVTALFPIAWAIVNGLFVLFLVVRRSQLYKK